MLRLVPARSRRIQLVDERLIGILKLIADSDDPHVIVVRLTGDGAVRQLARGKPPGQRHRPGPGGRGGPPGQRPVGRGSRRVRHAALASADLTLHSKGRRDVTMTTSKRAYEYGTRQSMDEIEVDHFQTPDPGPRRRATGSATTIAADVDVDVAAMGAPLGPAVSPGRADRQARAQSTMTHLSGKPAPMITQGHSGP